MAKRPKPRFLDQNLPLRELVLEKLEMKWSPEQISGWLSRAKEWVPVTGYINFSAAAHAITGYIVEYYSSLRPHEDNALLSPDEPENRYWKNSEAVASFS